MNSFRIARELARVPRLFRYLLLWPLLIGVVLTLIQSSLSIAAIRFADEKAVERKERLLQDPASPYLRFLLFGSFDELPPIQVCRWEEETPPKG